jgi:regulator of chromosome condensation
MIEKVGARDAVDIFAGNHHSFYINSKHQIFGWGLNNHGQLGIGNKENTSIPTLVRVLSTAEHQVLMMAGGEHHSIAVTREGKVYCWGRNDEGQCGRGDLFGRYKRQKAQEEYARLMKAEDEEKQRAAQQAAA